MCPPCVDMDIDPALIDSSLILASEILYNLTGRVWPGVCADVIRPVRDSCFSGAGRWFGSFGVSVYGTALGRRLGDVGWASSPSFHEQTGGTWLGEIYLPGFPVDAVSEVKLDGVILNASRYRIDNRRSLVALPQAGDTWGGWPCCQNMRLAPTEKGTFQVSYTFGAAPPPGGVHAAATYACQLALSANPITAGLCRLPQRITNITRQGISMAIIDPLTIIGEGMIGLPEVDTWVNSVWAGRKRRRASITALDQRKPTRRNG